MHTAFSVAKYFLFLSDEEAGDTISNLKLQKLLYYAQGFHLALNDSPLFAESIEAWTHGPVVPVVYQLYKHAGASAIPRFRSRLARTTRLLRPEPSTTPSWI